MAYFMILSCSFGQIKRDKNHVSFYAGVYVTFIVT